MTSEFPSDPVLLVLIYISLPIFIVDALSHSSPSLKTGLDIGRQGELYLFERKYESALESFTSALGILVPFLNKEPKGDRRSLLLQQVKKSNIVFYYSHLLINNI